MKRILSCIVATTITLTALVIVLVQFLYQPKMSGLMYLRNAIPSIQNSSVEIYREKDTGIAHVFFQNERAGAYGNGFVHAQERLWQLEKNRRFCRGELSEVMGEKTIPVDTFSRKVGFFRIA